MLVPPADGTKRQRDVGIDQRMGVVVGTGVHVGRFGVAVVVLLVGPHEVLEVLAELQRNVGRQQHPRRIRLEAAERATQPVGAVHRRHRRAGVFLRDRDFLRRDAPPIAAQVDIAIELAGEPPGVVDVRIGVHHAGQDLPLPHQLADVIPILFPELAVPKQLAERRQVDVDAAVAVERPLDDGDVAGLALVHAHRDAAPAADLPAARSLIVCFRTAASSIASETWAPSPMNGRPSFELWNSLFAASSPRPRK